jgi:hypothetical protein
LLDRDSGSTPSKLEVLSFTMDGNLVTNASIDRIAMKCHSLKDIIFLGKTTTNKIPTDCMVNLLKSCKELKSINGKYFNAPSDVLKLLDN